MSAAAASEGDWEAPLATFEENLAPLEAVLAELEAKSLPELRAKLSPLEGAKFDMTLAYSLNSLFWMYLSTRGIDPKDHPVAQELKRVQLYMKKIKAIETGGAPDDVEDDDGGKKSKRPKVNKDAAKRVVTAGIGAKRKESADAELHKAKKAKSPKDKKKKKSHSTPTTPKDSGSAASHADSSGKKKKKKKKSKEE